MTHFFLLRFEVFCVVWVRNRVNWDLLHDLDIIGLEADNLAWGVREQADFVDTEVSEDLGAESVVTKVHRET